MINLIGWIGNLGFLIGAILLAKKDISGFYAQIIANVCYIIQSCLLNNIPLFWLSVMLVGIDIWGIINWRKK